jgi:hypothetical protein
MADEWVLKTAAKWGAHWVVGWAVKSAASLETRLVADSAAR